MPSKYKELVEKHGTLEEFTNAVYRAYCDLFITQEEMDKAILEYRDELVSAKLHDRRIEEND